MSLYWQAVLLFTLNLIDAFLTVFWVRNGYAPEGNLLMATLLDMGDIPFLTVKLAMGIVAAYCFWNWSQFKLARYGLSAALVAYGAVMGVHILTGLAVAGVISSSFIHQVSAWSKAVLIFLF
jgi:hypothetical protein